MLMNFDWFDRAEYPQIILTKPDGTEIDEIGVYSELNVDMKYNDISEISFRVDFDTKKQDTYDLIKGKKYLEINLYGKFIIDDVVSVDDGVSKYKEILCKSVDFELSYKRFTLEPKTYKLYDVFEPEETLMYRIISLIPSWSIGSMDASIGSLYRYFDVEDIDLLSFMLGDMEDAYQCIFEFDYFNREINIKALENVGEDTNIYISFDNLMDKIELSELNSKSVPISKSKAALNSA